MGLEIKTEKIDFSGKDYTETGSVTFDSNVKSAFAALTGFYQKFNNGGQNVETAEVAVTSISWTGGTVDLEATMKIQPANNKNITGWVEIMVIADVGK
ncbi:hypothetical protein POV27_00195 [Aureisphaera galaxeae]|uniref:hypothetical protein n=1 Tax=Aureisphaera galaxeae TaxID=1538023 RepID=UPI002350660E|nr:hypothetical protein [Aureisphaera galaxeae]MDC8002455.1 hypothetical protein [Aureisphaera galaxeae]